MAIQSRKTQKEASDGQQLSINGTHVKIRRKHEVGLIYTAFDT